MSTLSIAAALFLGCSSTPTIEGVVQDHTGAPVEGVKVKVRKSAYETTSKPDGTYALPYAPGSFEVEYSKDGLTTHVVELDIQESVSYPAEAVELYPNPSEPGLYVLTKGGMEKLAPAQMDKQVLESGWTWEKYKVFCTGEGGPKVAAGKIRVIDTLSDTVLPAKLGGYGLIHHYTGSSKDEGYNGLFKDERTEIGDERLTLRSFDGESGQHAYVTIGTNRDGDADIDAKASCYPLQVE